MDYNEYQRQEAYKNRIGKVYGMFEVINVERDDDCSRGQKWTMRCIKCGKIRITRSGADYVKGKCGTHCSCMNKANQPKIPKEPKPRIPYSEKMKKHYGKIYGRWKVIRYIDGEGMEAECLECGRRVIKNAMQIINGKIHCVCEFRAKYDESYIGKRYGHLVVRSIVHKVLGGKNRLMFDCVCDCGNSRLARPIYLENGNILCCGADCIYKNENTKLSEGNSKELLYTKWRNIKDRCYNPKNCSYETYGGRGIKVCDEWKNDYVAFRKWSLANGYKDGLTIDRIDPDGDYEPSNCQYITIQENVARARKGQHFTIKSNYKKPRKSKYSDVRVKVYGYECDIQIACMLLEVSYETILNRVKKGMSWQEAFDTPIKR